MFLMIYTQKMDKDAVTKVIVALKYWTSVVKQNVYLLYTGQELSQREEEELMSWESFMKENYLASVKQDSSQSMEKRMEDTAEK